MINFTKAEELKEKKLYTITKINDSPAIKIKNFDAETGEEKSDIVETINVEELIKQKKEAQDLINGIDKILTEVSKLIYVKN